MPSLRDVQTKIQSIKKTKQITKAMNMVATSRLRGSQGNMDRFRPYADKFVSVLSSFADKIDKPTSLLMLEKEFIKKVHIILCTSDRGLCGGFNFNLIDIVGKFLKDKTNKDLEVSFTSFGKKGFNWIKKNGFKINSKYFGIIGSNFGFDIASRLCNELINDFTEGKYEEVYIVYSQFVNTGKQVPRIKKILPISSVKVVNAQKEGFDYQAEHICEPSFDYLFSSLLPESLRVQIHNALLETSTSEHAARMTAMDNATKACNDMIDTLTLAYNKARQASITADLMDIVSGAEALKG